MKDHDNLIVLKIISIFTLFVLGIFIVCGYADYVEYEKTEARLEQAKIDYQEKMNDYIISFMEDSQNNAESCLSIQAVMIQKNILDLYSKQSLDYDLSNPSEESKLSYIFDYVFTKDLLNEEYYNDIIAIGNDNIVWNRGVGTTQEFLSVEQIKEGFNNNDLALQAINAIQNTDKLEKYYFIYWNVTNDKYNTDNMDISNLINLYNENGLDSLKNFELLVPYYITKDGDIFGSKDISSVGKNNNTLKITIVKRVNVYDIFKSHNKYLDDYKNNIESICDRQEELQIDKLKSLTTWVILCILTVIGTGIMQNKIPRQKH